MLKHAKKLLVRLKRSKVAPKVVELAVTTFAIWLNREAILLIAALKFCFLVLEFIQSKHRTRK
jgi:hypothetical protein